MMFGWERPRQTPPNKHPAGKQKKKRKKTQKKKKKKKKKKKNLQKQKTSSTQQGKIHNVCFETEEAVKSNTCIKLESLIEENQQNRNHISLPEIKEDLDSCTERA